MDDARDERLLVAFERGFAAGWKLCEEKRSTYAPSFDTMIEDTDISARARNALATEGIHTLTQLCRYTADDLLEFRNFAETSLREVKVAMAVFGKHLRYDLTTPPGPNRKPIPPDPEPE